MAKYLTINGKLALVNGKLVEVSKLEGEGEEDLSTELEAQATALNELEETAGNLYVADTNSYTKEEVDALVKKYRFKINYDVDSGNLTFNTQNLDGLIDNPLKSYIELKLHYLGEDDDYYEYLFLNQYAHDSLNDGSDYTFLNNNHKIDVHIQEKDDYSGYDVFIKHKKISSYTKTEIDTKINDINSIVETCQNDIDILKQNKANTTDVYSKTEIDVMLENVGTSDDVYTKVEVNNLLSGKANATDVYSKSEIDNLITGALESDY